MANEAVIERVSLILKNKYKKFPYFKTIKSGQKFQKLKKFCYYYSSLNIIL